jgi:hypothetical protein
MLFVYFDDHKAKVMIALEETRVEALRIIGDGSRCHSERDTSNSVDTRCFQAKRLVTFRSL